MNKTMCYVGLFLIFIGCNDKIKKDEWNEIKKARQFDKLLMFTSQNLNNSFSDSAITYLSDTSIQFMTHGIVIKDSIDKKTNQSKIYSDFEYDCIATLPPFKKRVAFRIEIKNDDSLLVNNTLCKQDEIKTILIDFVLNANNLDSLPPRRIVKTKEWGDIEITVAVIEIYCNLNELGFKEKYIEKIARLMNIIYNGYNDIRNAKAKEIFKKNFTVLNPNEKELIRQIHPLRLYIKIESFNELKLYQHIPVDPGNILIIDDEKDN